MINNESIENLKDIGIKPIDLWNPRDGKKPEEKVCRTCHVEISEELK